MRAWCLSKSGPRKDQTNFLSDHDAKLTGSFLAGWVLAGRYKILEKIGADSFKAHDLALDQTVTVRQVMLTGRRDSETWRQKVQQLTSVRDPNFLNVLDVISDKSGDFVITERPRGQSVAELLRERSRFDLDEVLRLMTPLPALSTLLLPLPAVRIRSPHAGCSPKRAARVQLIPSQHSSSSWTSGNL